MTEKTPPLGLSEADENNFRVLLTRIREHDPEYLSFLVVNCMTHTQPPNSLVASAAFDADTILIGFTLTAKGTTAASRLSKLYDRYQKECS